MDNIRITYTDKDCAHRAEELGSKLGIAAVELENQTDKLPRAGKYVDQYDLHISPCGASLYPRDRKVHGPIQVDFFSGVNNHRRRFGGGNGQAIAKAVGVSGRFYPTVLDMTAGLGGDSFVLASLGCNVKLFERNPVIAYLLADGISRALKVSDHSASLRDIMNRFALTEADSMSQLDNVTGGDDYDVVYLDPMFPHRSKSAKVKKEMQAFQKIVGPDSDSDFLVDRALQLARYRVVIKRPLIAGYLADRKPHYSLSGKNTRFDIFALQKLPS
ncbi:MAG: class I SAM-dependent methyltransferase [Porticoccaceae bacterium]|nr:class I SAM-dependent methyltransferase [Porticoccaceae bacterium]MDG1474215.1 class I SAM-dependent methyltransferase [Porticoccaceae bacterium]